MGIGGGITLAVLGLILMTNVIQVDVPWVNENALGVILLLAGVLVVVLTLTIWRDAAPWSRTAYVDRRRPTSRVVEREVQREDPPLP